MSVTRDSYLRRMAAQSTPFEEAIVLVHDAPEGVEVRVGVGREAVSLVAGGEEEEEEEKEREEGFHGFISCIKGGTDHVYPAIFPF